MTASVPCACTMPKKPKRRKPHRGGRPRPSTSPRFEQDEGDRLLDGIIDPAAKDLRAADDPEAAEAWASHLLMLTDDAVQQARLEGQDEAPIVEELVHRCLRRGDRAAAVVATALAAVVAPPLNTIAAQVASDLQARHRLPAWVEHVGDVKATSAWRAVDSFGDAESVIIGYAGPGATGQPAMGVLIDHELSGQAKDLFLAEDIDELHREWQGMDEEGPELAEIPVAEGMRRLRDSLAIADLWDGDAYLRSDEFASLRGLAWARVRRAGLDAEGYAQPEPPPKNSASRWSQTLLPRRLVPNWLTGGPTTTSS